MGKPRIPNQKKQYMLLNNRLAKYVAAVQSIYASLNMEAAKIAVSTGYEGDFEFKFNDFPETKKRVQDLQKQFVNDVGSLIIAGTSDEWKRSNLLQDMIADKVLDTYIGEHEGKEYKQYYQTNSPALQAFQKRVDKGMNLSQKIWNQSEGYKHELEEAISVGVERGMDAVTLSKRLSKYLNDYDKLRDDYKEKFGTASTSGDCEYRSIRLARSEINMAYRKAEQTRWQQFDFVKGYEIKLSGSHPTEDICDKLAGKYPKDFEFLGFHPNCMCYCVPILMTEDEFFSTKKTVEGEVTDVPPQFKEWCTENWARLADAQRRGTAPYYLTDNNEYARKEMNVLKAAELRHKNRDEEAILLAWKNRDTLFNMKDMY